MIAVHLDKIAYSYISEPVFQNLSWEIHDDQIVGLVGPNGCGKSTLLKLINGDLKSDTGFITRKSNLSIGFLTQEPDLDPKNTVWGEVTSAHNELVRVDSEINQIEFNLSQPDIYNNERKLAQSLDEYARLLDLFTELGGPGFDGQVKSILRQLGFKDSEFSISIDVLSGGQKKLVGLAKLLIMQPDLLLLDEPDNHLDMNGKDFLVNFIRNYPGGVIIVSHDRYLLDLVVDEIVELEDCTLSLFPGNFSEYTFEKKIRLRRQQQIFQVQRKEITRLEQSAKRLLTWGHVYDNEKFYKRGQNILKRIERMDKIVRPTIERKQMGLGISGWRGSNKVLNIENLVKVFYTKPGAEMIIFAGLETTIWRGERVGLIGPNGSGKSLLFKMILSEEAPTSGTITLGPSVKIGYYAQEHQTLDYNQTLINTVRYAAPLSDAEAVAFLGRFLFSYDQARGVVSSLSGGERSRLQMALLMLSGANFLLLDEPTNNLDIASAEVLEETLSEFDGTVLIISHDRYLLDQVANKILEIDEGMLVEFLGNFSEYNEHKLKSQ
jgi:ATP-binding cassette subfamily F protein 3